MTSFTRDCFALLTCATIVVVFQCKADGLPPPTGLSYKWLDNFTVELSWKMPRGLPDDGTTKFRLDLHNTAGDKGDPRMIQKFEIRDTLLTEDKGSDNWTYSIWTADQNYNLNGSVPANITIKTLKPRAEVVKDFKCLMYGMGKLNCSWIPAHQPLNLTLFYRICGRADEDIESIKKCDQPYSSGKRNGCYLNVDIAVVDICILVETEAGMSTFRPKLGVPLPKLNITEKGDLLHLSWTPPSYGKPCWIYEVCYNQCNAEELQICQNTSNKPVPSVNVPYDKRCRYEFTHRILTDGNNCPSLSSDMETVQYGTNDWTLTVVAIVIPIILSACVILSCYCFRRHSAIICPIIPDPSTLLKEMMSGSKEIKTTTWSLYTPVPEPVDTVNVAPMTESSVPQQNY